MNVRKLFTPSETEKTIHFFKTTVSLTYVARKFYVNAFLYYYLEGENTQFSGLSLPYNKTFPNYTKTGNLSCAYFDASSLSCQNAF